MLAQLQMKWDNQFGEIDEVSAKIARSRFSCYGDGVLLDCNSLSCATFGRDYYEVLLVWMDVC